MTVITKLDFKQYLSLMYILTYRKPMMIILTILGLIMLFTSILYFLGLPVPVSSTPYMPLFFGIFTIVLPLFIYRNSKRNFSSHGRLNEQISYEFTEDKIIITGESFKTEMDWTKLYRIEELPKWILIYQNRIIANVILKSSFDNNLNDFKNLVLSKQIKSKFKK